MFKRISAISFIWVCTTVAWMVLGGTIFSRTYSSDDKLQSKVGSTWGTKQQQLPPNACYSTTEEKTVEREVDGKKVVRTETLTYAHELSLDSSRIDVDLDLAHRQKGLLWYSTYAVKFAGEYQFTNPNFATRLVSFRLPFPAQQAIYDDLVMDVTAIRSRSRPTRLLLRERLNLRQGRPRCCTSLIVLRAWIAGNTSSDKMCRRQKTSR